MTKTRLLLPVLAAAAALALLAGCGSDDSSSSTDPASVAPPETPVFIEAKIQPTGTLKSNLETIAKKVAGVGDLGGTIVSYIETAAADADEPFEFDKDVQPWLGESAGIFLTEYDGDDFEGTGIAVEVTETGEAQDFIDKYVKSDSDEPLKEKSYEGIDYKFDPSDEDAIGIVGNFIVYAEDTATFEAAVDATNGESLAEVENYDSITPSEPQNSLANVFVDIAGLVKAAGSEVDPDAVKFFEASGIELEKSSALLSLVPGTDNIEIDVASKFGEEQEAVPAAGAGDLMATLPANSVAALGVGDLGATANELIDTIDEEGIPGEIPPNQLKETMSKAGIDLGSVAGNLGDAAVFVEGRTQATLGGAVVIKVKDSAKAKKQVADIGKLVRANRVPGVTAVTGKASGFSVPSGPGQKPIVVATKGDRLAIGYGLPATVTGLESESGATLEKTKAYNQALNSLAGTPITGFAAGRPVLRLIEGMLTDTDEKEELEELTPYLSKVPFLAIGSETKGDVVQAKLIVGVTE